MVRLIPFSIRKIGVFMLDFSIKVRSSLLKHFTHFGSHKNVTIAAESERTRRALALQNQKNSPNFGYLVKVWGN